MPMITRLLTSISRVLTGISFMVIIFAVIYQLLGRSDIVTSVVWTEELTRFALLFLTAFGLGLGFRSGNLVNVDIVTELLPKRLGWALRLIVALITFGFCAVLIKPALFYVSIGVRQTAPSLGIHMNYVFASVLVAFISLAAFSLLRVIEMLTATGDGYPERLGEE